MFSLNSGGFCLDSGVHLTVRSVFCHSSEGEYPIREVVFSSSRSNHRSDLRSDNHSFGGSLSQGLSRQTSPRQVSRYRIGQYLRISHKQFLPAANHNCKFISQSLAGRVVLQMDKTKSPHQSVLWHIRECGEVADLDSSFGIYLGSNHEKTAPDTRESLHNLTNSKCNYFRTGPIISATYRS